MPRTKKMSTTHPRAGELTDFPNFSKTGSIRGMKAQYYGKHALLVKCGSYIYNVSTAPDLYNAAE